MISVNNEKCIGCGVCVQVCPVGVVRVEGKLAVIGAECVGCGSCVKYCKVGAMTLDSAEGNFFLCKNCGVNCKIPEGRKGACKRFSNINGTLVLNRPLQIPMDAEFSQEKTKISKPIVSAVGAGAAYPDYKPAPYIVTENRGDIDVVTVVTEAPVSYSSMMVKIDTNAHIGDDGTVVRRSGRDVGMVTTEQYGSHILVLGGVNKVKGSDGMFVVRTMVEIGNKDRVELTVDNGVKLGIQVGEHPVINGFEDDKMRVGCGGACCGLFAKSLAPLVDEAIILDHHITGLFTMHPAGAEMKGGFSGVTPVGRLSTPGRYFFEHGAGWGGTAITDPIDAIKEIDMSIAKAGMKILVAETTWRKIAIFEIDSNGKPIRIEIPEDIEAFRKMAAGCCEESRVSAMYYAGVGGSARAGVTTDPIKITKAVHRGEATLSIAGAPAYVMPGGGITFLADVEKMIDRPFNYTPSPAVVAPIEYTMSVETYRKINGHIEAMRSKQEVLSEGRFERVQLKD